jgi:hypothetical protein
MCSMFVCLHEEFIFLLWLCCFNLQYINLQLQVKSVILVVLQAGKVHAAQLHIQNSFRSLNAIKIKS